MQEIKVIIDENGEVTVDVGCGVKGGHCKELTADLEKALGETVDDTIKPQFYEEENQLHNKNTTGQGGY